MQHPNPKKYPRESGKLKPSAGKAELQRLRAAARATAIKDKSVSTRLSSVDLLDIQAKALEEGMPYQTLIASVLHKYVSGKLSESRPPATVAKRRLTPQADPGAVPREDYLAPLGLSVNALSNALGVPATRIHEIVNGMLLWLGPGIMPLLLAKLEP